MRRFLLHTLVFLTIVLLSCLYVFMQADGHTDAFYVKFTTPKQQSLIIGSSRAAQGLQPQYIDSLLGNSTIYNYAFSRVHTPYGAPYLESIKKKLDTTSANGVFILEVNPWTVCGKIENKSTTAEFWEESSFLGTVEQVTIRPNFYYLLNFYEGRNVEILTKKGENYHGEDLYVHDNGWYQVRLVDSESRKQERIKSTLKSYERIKEEYVGLSKARMEYLRKTIEYLQNFGTVYLVRLPIQEEMLMIEDDLLPNFDTVIETLSNKMDILYINGTKQNLDYDYIDGHHLDIASGKAYSIVLANEIKKHNKR